MVSVNPPSLVQSITINNSSTLRYYYNSAGDQYLADLW